MGDVEFDKKELFKNWDECGIDLKNYNRAIREKVNKIELILEKSKLNVENPFAEQPYSDKIEQDMKVNQKLQHRITELEKEKEKLEMQILTDKKIHELEKSNIKLQTQLTSESQNLLELKKEKEFLTKKVDSREKISFVMMKKYYSTIAIAGLVIGGFVGGFTFYENSLEDDYVMLVGEHAKSKYLIQNLRGDTLATWFPWMLAGSQALHVNILDNKLATEERIDVIKSVINSEETIDIDNLLTHKGPKGTTSTYYKGWVGALQIAAQQNTELQIPINFEFSSSKRLLGDITVELLSLSDPDGYSGYTKSLVDKGEILKSHIIIYDVNSISNEQLSIIMMHEFGHALGLAHSSAPDDLMYPVIETNFPYISECMIDAIAGLYDGIKASEVECQN
ncbi:MAG: matrixin family metalloprotease [Thaumarchaeota archaeon]|nr:matrixin family metalloprotease [Nitrososphaerota archaeon]